jgi:hypothetical protein
MLFFFLLSWLLVGIPDGPAAGPGSQMTGQHKAGPNGPKLQQPAEADNTYCCGPDIPPPKPPTGR